MWRPTSQTMQETGPYSNLDPYLAIDGHITSNVSGCAHPEALSHITLTDTMEPYRAKWSVNLGGEFTVVSVTVFNRDNEGNGTQHSKDIHICTTYMLIYKLYTTYIV